ncbi:ectomycorrhiza-upregulated zf-MYND domain-containing [Brachionus plicatilis]|uniref:Ectomycorrhiza-upregulated zf-MYND domain-containing n=1 Tax=Brachionus plicatilis TaxID=10195 RepID=A0A3M7S325_BRAPC|nr:ectomycorrhiza-upregulated zf-MYND domain-containing [Brachionus plicatilis]
MSDSNNSIHEPCKACAQENARFRCGNCKSIWYCSKECQKTDWKNHKPNCNYDAEKLISIVVVNGDEVFDQKVPKFEVDPTNGWIPCVITEMIGIPVMVKRWAPYTKQPHRELGIFYMVDPVSGLAGTEWQMGCGVIAFAQMNKTDFPVQLFWDLYSYIYTLMDYYGDENFDYEKFKKNQLNYKSFREYQIEEHKLQGIID